MALASLPAYVWGLTTGQLLWAGVYGFLILMVVYNLLMYEPHSTTAIISLLALFILPLTVTLMFTTAGPSNSCGRTTPNSGASSTPSRSASSRSR